MPVGITVLLNSHINEALVYIYAIGKNRMTRNMFFSGVNKCTYVFTYITLYSIFTYVYHALAFSTDTLLKLYNLMCHSQSTILIGCCDSTKWKIKVISFHICKYMSYRLFLKLWNWQLTHHSIYISLFGQWKELSCHNSASSRKYIIPLFKVLNILWPESAPISQLVNHTWYCLFWISA